MRTVKLVLFASIFSCSLLSASESIRAHDKDITDIQMLTKQIYQQAAESSALPKDFILSFILPGDLKKYHVVTGINGKQRKLLDLRENFAPGSAKFEKFIALMEGTESQPIKFNKDRTFAVIQKPGSSLKAKFRKYQGKWYVSY